MTRLKMKPSGEIRLSRELRRRYGFKATTPIRLIETRYGVLLVPLTKAAMDEGLQKELTEWQTLGAAAWGTFPFEVLLKDHVDRRSIKELLKGGRWDIDSPLGDLLNLVS